MKNAKESDIRRSQLSVGRSPSSRLIDSNQPPALHSNAKPDAYPQTTYATEAQAAKVYASETSLKLYHLTKNHPQSLDELRAHFPTESAAEIKQILQGFIDASILKLSPSGRYEFLLPNTYLNFSKFRFNGQVEEKKDRSIFNLMKEHAGDRSFWEDQDYFTMDAFLTPEQAKEISQQLDIVREKAKLFANQNHGKEPTTMNFRRIKFYNMIFGIAALLLLPFTALGQLATTGFDQPLLNSPISIIGGGGDDPTEAFITYLGGTGDDPKAGIAQIQNWDQVYNINFDNAFIITEPIPAHGSNTLIFEGLSPQLAESLVLIWEANSILHDLNSRADIQMDDELIEIKAQLSMLLQSLQDRQSLK